jgi:iron complex transport system permease protein
LLLLAVASLLAFGSGLFEGGSALAPRDVVTALFHPDSGSATTIVWSLRLPRIETAAVVGAALASAGYLLQGMLRNPLVDPFLTGVSAGAGAAIAIGVSLGLAAPLVPALGFAAGLGTALLVAALARRGSGIDAERLILAGVSLSALFSAIVTLTLTRVGIASAYQILAWLAGSLAGRGTSDVLACTPYLLAGFALAAIAVPSLNAMRAGLGVARAAGVELARVQWILLAAAALLTAAAVSLSGIVGFVGLIVPHLARRFVGNDARTALPVSALLGAALVVVADAGARAAAAPTEVPLGVVLALVGVPAFLYLYLRGGRAAKMIGT